MSYPRSTIDRFWQKVDAHSGECWIWLGQRRGGYGRFWIGEHRKSNRKIDAHRFSYELTHGAIPPGLQVLHRCDNRPCVQTPLYLVSIRRK